MIGVSKSQLATMFTEQEERPGQRWHAYAKVNQKINKAARLTRKKRQQKQNAKLKQWAGSPGPGPGPGGGSVLEMVGDEKKMRKR